MRTFWEITSYYTFYPVPTYTGIIATGTLAQILEKYRWVVPGSWRKLRCTKSRVQNRFSSKIELASRSPKWPQKNAKFPKVRKRPQNFFRSFRSISVSVLNICHYSLFKWVMTAVFCNQEQCIDYAQHKEHSDYHHGDLCAGLLQQIDRSSIMVALTNDNKQYSYCCESRSITTRCIAD